MKLKKIQIEGLYGSFSVEIDFNAKLNLLVGINGSGKTSVLNCIDWLLRPNLVKLATTPFERIQLHFSYREKSYTLRAVQTADQLIISEVGGKEFPSPITVDFLKHPSGIRTDAELAVYQRQYRNLRPEPKERKLWKFLADIPHPLTVGLDRTISAETDNELYLEVEGPGWAREQVQTRSPMDKVREVSRERFSVYRQQMFVLNEKLKTALVVSAFQAPFRRPRSQKKISLQEITRLESKVRTLLDTSLGLGSEASQIAEYFSSAKAFAKSAASDEKLQLLFRSQYQQIGEVAIAFDEYERSASEAFQPLGSYLGVVNSFFRDSGKAIGFDEQDGGLAFRFLGPKGVPVGAHRSLETLSSGERQVLILITFLAFVLQPDHVFVVDEPELSLHPKWQSNFLGAVVDQAPQGTQILVATHSPEIAGRYREFCRVLGVSR